MNSELAINGGTPVRASVLPYGRQSIEDDDIEAVARVLRSAWLTTGPKVEEFEQAFAAFTGARYAVAVNSGTAALHAAVFALGIGEGDEVIVPPITFAASANCVVYQGATPIFADVDPQTLLIDPDATEKLITPRTRAIIAVDYAGQPCDYARLSAIATKHGLKLIADACHSVGGYYRGHSVGTLACLSCFSLHPVKHITTGEGGIITTNDHELASRMLMFRNHGITSDHRQRERVGSWFYEMVELGYNYRITDFQCALGISQLSKLPLWLVRRQEIALSYRRAFIDSTAVEPLHVRTDITHAYHLFVLRVRRERDFVFAALRAEGIGVNVHYIPVYFHPYYRNRFGTGPGLCPVAERAYDEIISLPIFPDMTPQDVDDVVAAVKKVTAALNTTAVV